MASLSYSAFEKVIEYFTLQRFNNNVTKYVDMKSLFYERVHNYFQKNKSWNSKELTQQEISNIIKDLKIADVLQKNDCALSPSQYYNISKYEVIRGNKGQDILILKRPENRDVFVKVPASENIFDIILNAHLDSNHGSQKQIVEKLGHLFMIPKIYYNMFSQDMPLCTMCYDVNSAKNFGDCGHVSLINMSYMPDEKFQFILYYVDKATNFTLLRPLIKIGPSEIAMELSKIFSDFGTPKELQCLNVNFFYSVMQIIKKAYPNFNISDIAINMKSEMDASHIIQMIETWKRDTSCSSWSVGVHIIQWQLNNRITANEASKGTPYTKVFRRHDTDTDDIEITEEIVETFRTMSPLKYSGSEDDESINRIEQQEAEEEITISPSSKIIPISVDKLDETLGEVMSQKMKLEDSNVQSNSNTTKQQAIESPIWDQSQLHTEEDLGILIKNENDLSSEKFPTSPINSHGSQLLLKCLTSNLKKKNINSEFGKENSLDNGKNKNTESQIITCHVCYTLVIKSYTCCRCNKDVHLYCSLRNIESSNGETVLSTICVTCNMIEDRIKELKKTLGEIDNLIKQTEAKKEKKTIELSI